ncbi:MAG: phospholipase [Balneola sp.]|nr:MAG: phospholipase [Balneola sp.]
MNSPHKGMPVIKAGAELEEAKAVMIMIHGRGASAQSVLPLANEIDQRHEITFLAPQASNHTWYPYSFLVPREQNQPGIDSGMEVISALVSDLNAQGIPDHKIFFLGFSQGACLASDFVARNPKKYAGLFALSGGLIGPSIDFNDYSGDLKNTPIFLGCSDVDFHIPKERVNESAEVFEHLGASVIKKLYPGMGHLINEDEISSINEIIEKSI